MKHHLHFFLCIISLLVGISFINKATAQTPQSITVKDSKHFELDAYNNESDKPSITFGIDLFADYVLIGNTEKIIVSFDSLSQKTFTLNFPLNYTELSGNLNNTEASGFDKTKMYITTRSILIIYYWLDNIKASIVKTPVAGRMHLWPLIKIYSDSRIKTDGPDYKMEGEFQQIKKLSDEIKSLNVLIRTSGFQKKINAEQKLKSLYIDTINNYSTQLGMLEAIKAAKDKNKIPLDSIKNKFNKYLLQLSDSIKKRKESFKKDTTSSFLKNEVALSIRDSVNFQTYISKLKFNQNTTDIGEPFLKSKFEIAEDASKIQENYNKKIEKVKSIYAHISKFLNDEDSLNNLMKEKGKFLATKKQKIFDAHYYLVTDISFQFERGFLERIQVILTNDKRQSLFFENSYAIGFTSPYNYRNLNETQLYRRTARNTEQANDYIYLGEILTNYHNELDNYQRDYSPADTTVNHVDPSLTPIVKLYRSKKVDLLDAKIYSDLLGLADKNPNGIIQTEISKRVNLFTYRIPGSYKTNFGFFNFMDFEGSISKFEQKERYLLLRNEKNFVNNQIVSPSYATAIDFMRYQTFGLGSHLNLFLFDVPEGKFTITLDVGLRYNRIPISDSVRTLVSGKYTAVLNSNVPAAGMSTWYPRVKLEIFAERRYGFQLSWSRNYSNFFTNNQYKPIASYEKSDLNSRLIENNAHVSHTIEFYARFEPNPSDASSKLFFRTRLYFQKGDVNTFFSQIQVGYAHSLIYKK